MASQCKQFAWTDVLDGDIDLLTDTLKWVFYTSTYVPNKDDEFVDDGGADDLADGLPSVSGFTWSYGGDGRKSLGSKTVTTDDTDDEVVLDWADDTWASVGAGNTFTGTAVIKEITNDAASPIICNLDFDSSVVTNGGNITVNLDSEGGVNLNT